MDKSNLTQLAVPNTKDAAKIAASNYIKKVYYEKYFHNVLSCTSILTVEKTTVITLTTLIILSWVHLLLLLLLSAKLTS